ncbi:copper chaperone PCu(A)C [Sphingomonas floccifaciens]|uniref:Copper chaperone PCu(A)C n=1 Tax=Sphingomonas floccifaciens TaxID=1844115 RepID=A0ABW4N9Q0_9SPHN
MRLPIVAALCVMLAACQPTPAEPAVKYAWIRLPAVPGRPGAAYFTLAAGSGAITLVSVKTPAAKRAELHETMAGGHGATTMAALDRVAVSANAAATFAPGGRHVMLFDMDPALKSGDETIVTLGLADGRTLEATATVRGAGDATP